MYKSVEKVSWICLLSAIIAPKFMRLFVFVIVLPNYSQHISFSGGIINIYGQQRL